MNADERSLAEEITEGFKALETMRNNEPVAYVDPIWMDRTDLVMSHQLEIGKLFARTQFTNYVPLYTHPVKELTDEEIKFIAYPFESVYTTYDKQTDTDTVHTRFDQLGFARAILRKAQEK